MYLALAGCIALAILLHWSFLILPLLGFAARVHKTISSKRTSFGSERPVNARTYLTVAAILLWIDLSALAGTLDYCARALFRARRHRSPDEDKDARLNDAQSYTAGSR
jgi:hypothetical protein